MYELFYNFFTNWFLEGVLVLLGILVVGGRCFGAFLADINLFEFAIVSFCSKFFRFFFNLALGSFDILFRMYLRFFSIFRIWELGTVTSGKSSMFPRYSFVQCSAQMCSFSQFIPVVIKILWYSFWELGLLGSL